MITCIKCGKDKPDKKFPKDRKIYGNICNVCMRHSKKIRPPGKRYYKYGLTPLQRYTLLELQQKHCAICDKVKRLILDHDHRTNKARGYLCHSCNSLIAGLDNTEFLGKAQAYLANPPAKSLYTE